MAFDRLKSKSFFIDPYYEVDQNFQNFFFLPVFHLFFRSRLLYSLTYFQNYFSLTKDIFINFNRIRYHTKVIQHLNELNTNIMLFTVCKLYKMDEIHLLGNKLFDVLKITACFFVWQSIFLLIFTLIVRWISQKQNVAECRKDYFLNQACYVALLNAVLINFEELSKDFFDVGLPQ